MAFAALSTTYDSLAIPFAVSIAVGIAFIFLRKLMSTPNNTPSGLRPVAVIPGLPVIGNLLQLKEKKPYKTFTKWAEIYGPIYSIKTGASRMIVLNSTDLAKEAMVTRYSSMSSRKLSKALQILTNNKCMVAMSDYDDFHKTVKRYILTNVLGANAQKRHRHHRHTMRENILTHLHASVKDRPHEAINFRNIFASELFGLSMKQAVGEDVKTLYVEDLGATLSKDDIYQILVLDIMEGAIAVDWRDFFPHLRWIPNKDFERHITRLHFRRKAVMNALINERKKQIVEGEEPKCYVDYLLSEAKTLTEEQLYMLIWETIIESSDTTLVTSEWAIYELAKDPTRQDRLLREIKEVCGPDKLTEEDLPKLPYLGAVFHETLRKHSPAPIVPLRYAHEDTQIAGYDIPAGSEIAINIYGCNMDEKQWEDPQKWKPERFLDEKYDPSDLYKTMAFGAGKRVCAGSLQAMLIACTAIGRFIQEFEWKLKGGEEENVDTVGLTTHRLHPLQVIVRPRT